MVKLKFSIVNPKLSQFSKISLANAKLLVKFTKSKNLEKSGEQVASKLNFRVTAPFYLEKSGDLMIFASYRQVRTRFVVFWLLIEGVGKISLSNRSVRMKALKFR